MSATPSEAQRFREAEQASRDAARMKTRCAICEWEFEGTTAECREQATAHRSKKHPEVTSKRRSHRGSALHTWVHPGMDDDHKVEIETERRRRARLHGVEIEE